MTSFRLIACTASGEPETPIAGLPDFIRQACIETAALYRKVGFVIPWVKYVALSGDLPVGGGAFVGSPVNGRVEIAYYTLPELEGRGFATLTARHLVAIATRSDPAVLLTAKTLPRENPSTTILQKLGFQRTGVVVDDGIGEAWAWLLDPVHSGPTDQPPV